MKEMKHEIKKVTIADVIIGIIFICIIVFIIVNQILKNNQASELLIQTSSDNYYYSLDQKKTINIKGEMGDTIILIDNGRFRFIESPCKNKICIHTGWVKFANFPVICLPNKVSAYITTQKKETEFDGITQ